MKAIVKSGLLWLHGLAAVFVSGAAHSIAGMVIKPDAFNLGAQWKSTLVLAATSGVISAAAYLASSPVPRIPDTPKTEENTQ